jgi:hypothetical protein
MVDAMKNRRVMSTILVSTSTGFEPIAYRRIARVRDICSGDSDEEIQKSCVPRG